ncbi:hypothetical protein VNO77_19596 [Canavalia gladiata]|uniref:Uncharacterized protein n=1 Tax=Canavalia gladiata TaxID=3824 RepID=A0AAN9LRU4_CANGL
MLASPVMIDDQQVKQGFPASGTNIPLPKHPVYTRMDESTFFSDMDQDIHPVFSDQDKKKPLTRERKRSSFSSVYKEERKGAFRSLGNPFSSFVSCLKNTSFLEASCSYLSSKGAIRECLSNRPPANPSEHSNICPTFIREGTPNGFKTISTVGVIAPRAVPRVPLTFLLQAIQPRHAAVLSILVPLPNGRAIYILQPFYVLCHRWESYPLSGVKQVGKKNDYLLFYFRSTLSSLDLAGNEMKSKLGVCKSSCHSEPLDHSSFSPPFLCVYSSLVRARERDNSTHPASLTTSKA